MGEAFEIIAMLAGSYALIRFGAFILANTDDALMGELPEIPTIEPPRGE
jgi:hypothetical protein